MLMIELHPYIYIYIYIYIKIGRSTKRFEFFEFIFFFLLTCYIYVCFQLVPFVWEHVWHKAFLMVYSMRLELLFPIKMTLVWSNWFLSLLLFSGVCLLWSALPSLWCNCYRHRKWTRRHEFKSWTRLIAFHIALIPLGKVWIQLFSLQLWINSRTD